jgi:hypothetical protein
MEEQEFFSSENVYISLTRFVAFGKTYAMSGVTSVRAAEIKPSQAGPMFIAALGLLFLVIGCYGNGAFLGLAALLLILAAILAGMQKPQYYVCLSISSGEVQAVKSESREYIAGIVQALNDCIVARG